MTTAVAERVHRRVEHLMGMPISLALRGRHAVGPRADEAWDAVIATLRDVDRVFSTYRADSFVSRLDRDEVTLDEGPVEVAEVLALGELARVQSHGAFDIRRPGPDGVPLLDPSGVVKGWAVDRAVRPLLALDDTDVCLSAGGDMVARTRQGSTPWRVGVEDPADPSRVLAVVPLRRGAVASSGTTHRGQHLVDARTGRPPRGVASVTVVADTLTWADLDATAAYALGPEAAAWLRSRGRTGLVVWADGRREVVAPA